jgi:hypothetical protein
MTCTHSASAQTPPAQPRVVMGVPPLPVETMANMIAVTGCPFQIPFGVGTKPQPCVRVQWTMPATRVLIAGSPPLLQPTPGPGPGACLSVEQIPQGPPMVSGLQTRVIAS